MLDALVAGATDRPHGLIVSAILAHLDLLDEQIQLLSEAIEEQLALSRARLSCSARSPASSGALPKWCSLRSAPT